VPQAVGVTPLKQHQFGFLVFLAVGAESLVPGVFGRGQNLGDKTGGFVVGWRAMGGRRALLNRRHAAATAQHVEYGQRVDAEKIAGDQRNGDGAEPHAAAAETQATTTGTAAAPVFQVSLSRWSSRRMGFPQGLVVRGWRILLLVESRGAGMKGFEATTLAVKIDGVAGFLRDLAGRSGKVFVLAGVENGT
jgi:hypothetical protein